VVPGISVEDVLDDPTFRQSVEIDTLQILMVKQDDMRGLRSL
jgi:hypothetical protein